MSVHSLRSSYACSGTRPPKWSDIRDQVDIVTVASSLLGPSLK